MKRAGRNRKVLSTRSRKVSSEAPPPAPPQFIHAFFENVSQDDRATLPHVVQQSMAASLWQLAQQRKRGHINLRLFNPSFKKNGWTSSRTVLEIVNDDMPCLLDSITGELQRRGLTVHLSIHPILNARRNARGELIDLKGKNDEAESMMHIHIDHIMDQNTMNGIANSLRSILGEVRTVVSDRPALVKQTKAVIAETRKNAKGRVAKDDIEESCLFLEWLDKNNYTFLGYRTLDLTRANGQVKWKIVPRSSLGILRDEEERLFGNMRDLKTQPPEVLRILRQKRLIIVAKTNMRSRVHRNVPMDAIFVQRLDRHGNVTGEHMFVGLFTSASYLQTSLNVPYLRRRIEQVLARAPFGRDSHDGRALMHILDNYPRDELFQIDPDDLYHHALEIVQLQERARVALFLRKDPFGRFVTCLIYIPRERFDTQIRKKIQQRLETAFDGKTTTLNIRIDDSALARVYLTIEVHPGSPQPYQMALEAELREMCRSWPDRLLDSLLATHGEDKAHALFARYGEAFPRAYSDATDAFDAVRDIEALECVLKEGRFVVDFSESGNLGLLRLKLFHPEIPLVLSDVLPLIENMGLKARHMGGPYEVTPCDGCPKTYIHEFVCRSGNKPVVNVAGIKTAFEEAFSKVFAGEVENDTLNALTLRAGLGWHEITMLRALARYLRQLRIPYDQEMMAATLMAHPHITQLLVELFHTRHDPDFEGDRNKGMARLAGKIETAARDITALEEDRIVRRYLNLIQSSMRTNYFQRNTDGTIKSWLSIKFDSRAIEFMPLPKPLYEIFLYSPRVEAVHLRGGKVARGGIRWSDRKDDFRNEVLALMKAQMVKNAVIVPVGSKGGFIVKQPPKDPAEMHAEGVACYRIMMRGLLDLTDNRVNGKIAPPPHVVCHDPEDPYLVVAADKGTATFSDIANGISQEYGFWLDDAFASGGSAGYDHKDMGITARGVWEGVKRHFREIGKDIQTTDFTCIGVGDMSGDVFGNGMMLSKHTRLIGAFDHRHIFCDPEPDAATSYAERVRLFKLPRSSWADYNRKKISKGGGIFARSEKTIRLTPEIKKAYGIEAEHLTPNELMQAMLRAKVELIYFGGIGTYVKASDETHADVRDRNNDPIRVDGREIQAAVIGEGANLGMTQKGRIEYALNGGRLNTDAIDNSAGVATSDREVNIKILLRKRVTGGKITLPARNKLLAGMTDGVAHLVLRDNYRQTQAISIALARTAELMPLHARCIHFLEKTGLLNRAIEYLPDDVEMAERHRIGKGLTRPELAILLSYAKIWLYEQVLASDLPDDPFLHVDLMYYFPEPLKKNFEKDIGQHQLRREILATRLTNSLINRVGSHFVFTIAEQTGHGPANITRAYHLVRATYGLHNLWKEIESLDNIVPAQTQIDMFLIVNRMMDVTLPWFLTHNMPINLEKDIKRHRGGVECLTRWLMKNRSVLGETCLKTEKELVAQGVSKTLAGRMAIMPYLAIGPELTRLAGHTSCDIEEAAEIFFGLGKRLNLEWLRERVAALTGPESPWQREATSALLGDLLDGQRKLTQNVLAMPRKKGKVARPSTAAPLEAWETKNAAAIERFDYLMKEIMAAGTIDTSVLTLATRQLSTLVK